MGRHTPVHPAQAGKPDLASPLRGTRRKSRQRKPLAIRNAIAPVLGGGRFTQPGADGGDIRSTEIEEFAVQALRGRTAN